MAAKKKEAEGIALLSMYNDDEDMDLDDEEAEEDNDDSSEGGDIRNGDNNPFPDDYASGYSFSKLYSGIPPNLKKSCAGSPVPPLPPNPGTLGSFDVQESRRGPLGIVDYAHGKTAMSPEIEEGEIWVHVMSCSEQNFKLLPGSFRRELLQELVITQHQAFKQLLLSSLSNWINPNMKLVHQWTILVPILKVAYTPVMGSDEPQQEVDLLENVLPPIPNTKCSEELQRKI